MNCPHCGYPVRTGIKFCPECGADLRGDPREAARQRQSARIPPEGEIIPVANTGVLLGAEARRARLSQVVSEDQLVSPRIYNLVLLGVLLWGLLVNVVLCVRLGDVFAYLNPIVFFVIYFGCALAGTFIAGRSHRPLVSFLGYNLVVVPFGAMISTLVYAYGGINSSYVTLAFGYTLLITLGMLGASMAFPQLFRNLGGALLGVLVGLVLCEIVLLLLGIPQVVTDWVAAGLFSLYIGFDLYRSQQFPKTLDNAVDCALDIYLDIANLFIRLLRVMSRRKN